MKLNGNHNSLTDEALMLKAMDGHKPSFEMLYDRYSVKLYNYFMKMNRYDTHLAQDLTQDLFLKILEKGNQFDASKNFKTWIYSIANNMCKNRYRHAEVVDKAKTEWSASPSHTGPKFDTTLDNAQFSIELKKELELLDPAKRSSFILRFKHDFSIRQIAEITETSEGTVKSRLHYTLQTLSSKLSLYKDLTRK